MADPDPLVGPAAAAEHSQYHSSAVHSSQAGVRTRQEVDRRLIVGTHTSFRRANVEYLC